MKNARWILSRRLLPLVLVAATGLAHAQPAAPTVSTLPATAIGLTNATLNGTANPWGAPTSGWFEWGTTTNYGNVTPAQSLGTGSSNTNFSQAVGGLASGVTYHFRAVASNSVAGASGANQSFITAVFAQTASGLPGGDRGAVAWGDYDNDGRLDILRTGTTNALAWGATAQVWRNTGNGFSNINAGLPEVFLSSVAWGDFDNDGRLDILLTGTSNGSANGAISQVWRNTGSGFTNINAGLPGVFLSSVAWGDYDNDGRLDILLTGQSATGAAITQVLHNSGGGFGNINAGLPGVSSSSVAWGDYDNDGRLDILLTGYAVSQHLSQVWRNTGSGFTNINAGLTAVDSGSAAWGDYDNDGRLDILLTGFTNAPSGSVSEVWRNTGNGFTNINAGLPGVYFSSVAWGDYDNDGRLDILLSGTTNGVAFGSIAQVWRNTGGGFAAINAGLPGVVSSSVALGDYDNDGRLDILLTGSTNANVGSVISQVWRNFTPQTNTPPSAPSSPNFTVSNSTATLAWNAAADATTPAPGLTYNVRIGTTPGGSDALAPMAGANGLRRLPQLGNAQSGLNATFNYLQGTPYYWSVQAVDSAYAGSLSPLTVPPLNSGLDWMNKLLLDGSIEVVAAPPKFAVISLSGTNVIITGTNGTPGANYAVLTATNVAQPLSNWVSIATNQFNSGGGFSFTNGISPTEPQRFFRIRTP